MAKKKEELKMAAKEYAQTLTELISKVRESQLRAAVAVNTELVKLYWHIGKTISERQTENGWGNNVVEQLARDLLSALPGIRGFSRANTFRMRAFYQAYEKVAQSVRQIEDLPFFSIPWGHNILLIERVKTQEVRLWYARKTQEEGWSRGILEKQIKLGLCERTGQAITNFPLTLPKPQSDLAKETLKDPYMFDFLSLSEEYNEREVEQGLIDHIQTFLLELGKGFAFIGRQKHLEVGGNDYFLDLLFYHTNLRCYVVVELKSTAFKPEYAGKLNFYLSAVDDLLRHPEDRPTIGLLLCKTKNNFIAEYALKDINKPIGVAEYETKLIESLPKDLKGSLPSIEEIEAEIEKQKALKEIEVEKE